jgi:hypothetical protein
MGNRNAETRRRFGHGGPAFLDHLSCVDDEVVVVVMNDEQSAKGRRKEEDNGKDTRHRSTASGLPLFWPRNVKTYLIGFTINTPADLRSEASQFIVFSTVFPLFWVEMMQ